ncbi:MAG: hypothetical protein ONB49_17090, partial [candidate division KSB1 bacterium]|nr:hypothetical protein [candidate division KSB1 bacterium]
RDAASLKKQFTPTGVNSNVARKIFYIPPLGWLAVAIKAASLAEEINLDANFRHCKVTSHALAFFVGVRFRGRIGQRTGGQIMFPLHRR